jgi:hypothetical protein
MLLLVVSIMILNPLTDASKIYHFIRGQDTIKLYVVFNALEVRSLIGRQAPSDLAHIRLVIGYAHPLVKTYLIACFRVPLWNHYPAGFQSRRIHSAHYSSLCWLHCTMVCRATAHVVVMLKLHTSRAFACYGVPIDLIECRRQFL